MRGTWVSRSASYSLSATAQNSARETEDLAESAANVSGVRPADVAATTSGSAQEETPVKAPAGPAKEAAIAAVKSAQSARKCFMTQKTPFRELAETVKLQYGYKAIRPHFARYVNLFRMNQPVFQLSVAAGGGICAPCG